MNVMGMLDMKGCLETPQKNPKFSKGWSGLVPKSSEFTNVKLLFLALKDKE